jgi:hypothetical protein
VGTVRPSALAEIRLAFDHLRRWHPVRPFALDRNLLDAAPLESVAADADAVTHRNAVAHDQIEVAVGGVDDVAGLARCGLVHQQTDAA